MWELLLVVTPEAVRRACSTGHEALVHKAVDGPDVACKLE